jgi:peroxiredoxin/HPt (histidine-containing phosphotransfer) domain-containing protein
MRRYLHFFVALLLTSAGNAQQPSSHASEILAKAQESTTQGHFQDSVKLLRSLPKDELKTCFRCEIELAVAEGKLANSKASLEAANQALALASTAQQKETAHRVKGSALLGAASDSKSLAAAESEFRQALESDPDSQVAKFMLGNTLLREKRDPEGIAVLKAYLESHPDDFKLAAFAERLIEQPRRARERFAPEFEVTTAQGQHFTSKDLAGKVVVLDFWATWCPPCRESVPELRDLSHKYAEKKFVIISISNDDDQKQWSDFIAKKQMTWPQYFDDGKRVSSLFNVHSFPTYMVIDGEGAIVSELVGLDERQRVAARLKDTLKQMKELE